MSDKKYQIFISSTYEDLKEEREAVIKTILEMNHIPIGMEMFSAGDEDQWSVICRTIDTSDYYVVIIGHKYGSMTETGISYTEKEYDYAIEKGIPVLASIASKEAPSKSDRESDEVYDKLKAFKDKAKKKISRFWETKDELAKQVSTSLHNSFTTHPRTGWIRAEMDIFAVMQETATLSKENRELRKQLDAFCRQSPEIDFFLECEDQLTYKYKRPNTLFRREYAIDDIPDNLIEQLEEEERQINMNSATLGKLLSSQNKRNPDAVSSESESVVVINREPTNYKKSSNTRFMSITKPCQANQSMMSITRSSLTSLISQRINI
jgi:hypothetical protein